MPVTKRDVSSLSKSGSAKLKGDITVSEGSNVTLTQDGQDIEIAATGAAGAPSDATYITQTANGGLSAEQALAALATGIVKNTTTTGVLSIAAEGTDYYGPGGTDVAITDGGTGASTDSGARTNLGLAIGSDVQAYDADLAAIAGLTSAADKGIQFTGSGTAGTYDLTAAAKTVLDDSTVGDMVNTLGGATSTGTGGLVRATSPTLVTPALGTPASGVATNLTGTASGLTAGTVTTNANLTGDVTSVGNATTIGAGKVESEMLDLTIGVRAYRNGAVSYSSEADIVFDTENWDLGNNFNTTTGIFTAPVDGYYRVYCQCRITDLGDGTVANLRLYGNGAVVSLSTIVGASTGGDPTITATDTMFLSATQEIKATMNIGTSRALAVSSSAVYITIEYLGL